MVVQRKSGRAEKKHQPNAFWRYKQVHENVMDQFRRDGFVRNDTLQFSPQRNRQIRLIGEIECAGWIYIAVEKRLHILRESGGNSLVQTRFYSYNVVLEGEGNIIRYDSPHGHRPEHHVHYFDVLNGDKVGTLEFVKDGKHVTLGQAIEAARTWFYTNVDEIAFRRLRDRGEA